MEVKLVPQSTSSSAWVYTEKLVSRPSGFSQVSQICIDRKRLQMPVSSHKPKRNSGRNSSLIMEVSCSYKNYPASVRKSGSFPASLDDALILKNKSQEIEPYLDGRCVYLVGMMGSGKTTVGRVLADVLGYSFFDSDVLIEQAAGAIPVREIFKLHGEGFFRDSETEVLQELSSKQRLIVSTGGGAVIRPINWKYMRRGVTVWLDVPLEALAQRITAVGTNSRPLLHQESVDAYSQTLMRLTELMDERGEAYADADTRVSLERIATKLGFVDVASLSPSAIAVEALEQIEALLKRGGKAM